MDLEVEAVGDNIMHNCSNRIIYWGSSFSVDLKSLRSARVVVGKLPERWHYICPVAG